VIGTGEGSGGETALTQIAELPPSERRVLAALAVVGCASLSAGELAELIEVGEIAPLVADLERRGLITRDEKRRCALSRFGEEIRKTDDALATGERLLQYMGTLAKGGQLTPGRLLDDAEAILGLTEWAAEWQRWEGLLELVKTLQAGFEIASRIEQWLTLVDRGRHAAQALGDRRSEVWMLQQLAAASTIAGDAFAAQMYLREADELRRWRQLLLRRAKSAGPARIALWSLGLIVVAAAGGATSYAIANSNRRVDPRTIRVSLSTRVPVTVTVNGQTATTTTTVTLPGYRTVTLPPTTVVSTTTVTATVEATPPS
jgi:hypothetical protein